MATVKRRANRFDQCYRDAKRLEDEIRQLGKRQQIMRTDRGTFFRAATLLYVASLEALINRVIDAFLAPEIATLVEGKSRGLPLHEKWLVTPRLLGSPRSFDTRNDPWKTFEELIAVRNALVHPKANTEEFVDIFFSGDGDVDFDWPEEEPLYPHTKFPHDTENWTLGDVRRTRECVDQMVADLLSMVPERVTREWLHRKESWEDAEPSLRAARKGKPKKGASGA